jgi:hypothetical protein
MNIVSKTLMVNIENDITLHNGSITMTVIHQAFITEINGEIDVEIELMDFDDVVFLGTGIGYTKLRDTLESVGIEFQSMVDDESNDLISDQDIEYLKTLYIK